MKQWLMIVCLLLLLLAAGIFFIFRAVVPNAAQTFIPVKWQNVPLGESKAVVHEYLGEPDTLIAGKELWEQKLNDAKKYVLKVEYRGDTISSSYEVSYEVDILGYSSITPVKADSLR